MKNKFYFFFLFLLGVLFFIVGIFAFSLSSYFIYMIVLLLGLFILFDALMYIVKIVQGQKEDVVQVFIRIFFSSLFLLYPRLPSSFVVIIFALYVCVAGLSRFITYCYYKKEKVEGRLLFLLSSIVLIIVGITFLLSPYVHVQQLVFIFACYMIYLGLKYISRAVRELLSEDRKNSLKRRVRVSLPVFLVAFLPRVVIEYINQHFEIHDDPIDYQGESPLEVLIHVSKDGFGAIGHVDISYHDEVIAYGAYDESSTHLFGAVGDGVLFTVDKDKYILFCQQDDVTSYIFGYTLYLDKTQQERVEKTIFELKNQMIRWEPEGYQNNEANDYASRLFKATQAKFFKFKKGRFKHYFVMTNNCVLLADYIIGKSGIDIVNMNGIITPGTYFSYLEEESKKENSRVLSKKIYKS